MEQVEAWAERVGDLCNAVSTQAHQEAIAEAQVQLALTDNSLCVAVMEAGVDRVGHISALVQEARALLTSAEKALRPEEGTQEGTQEGAQEGQGQGQGQCQGQGQGQGQQGRASGDLECAVP